MKKRTRKGKKRSLSLGVRGSVERVKEQLDRGVITQEEYEQEKKKLREDFLG